MHSHLVYIWQDVPKGGLASIVQGYYDRIGEVYDGKNGETKGLQAGDRIDGIEHLKIIPLSTGAFSVLVVFRVLLTPREEPEE